MTWSHLDSMEVSQKQSRILGDGLSWPKQVMLDARTQGGAGRKKRQQSLPGMMLKCKTLRQCLRKNTEG